MGQHPVNQPPWHHAVVQVRGSSDGPPRSRWAHHRWDWRAEFNSRTHTSEQEHHLLRGSEVSLAVTRATPVQNTNSPLSYRHRRRGLCICRIEVWYSGPHTVRWFVHLCSNQHRQEYSLKVLAALELAKHKITVNAYAPGVMNTGGGDFSHMRHSHYVD